MAAQPVPYIGTGNQSQVVLGHYSVAQQSGAIAATPTALDVHARIRWAPTVTGTFLVLMRLKVGWEIITAITTAVRMVYQASIARGFTTDFNTAITNANMAAPAKTNQMRGSMSNSQMGTSGPGIATTAPCTGQTYTLDANPFAMTNWNVPAILTGTVSAPAGVAGNMQTLYEWTGLGQHPVVLSNQEGVAVQLTNTGWASGTVSLTAQWEWAEVLVF